MFQKGGKLSSWEGHEGGFWDRGSVWLHGLVVGALFHDKASSCTGLPHVPCVVVQSMKCQNVTGLI